MGNNQVVLITGEKAPYTTVELVFISLGMFRRSPAQIAALRELRWLCIDLNHRMPNGTGAALMSVGLLQDYDPATRRARVDREVAKVILAAVRVQHGSTWVAKSPLDIIRQI